MTVKLAKFFSGSASTPATQTLTSPMGNGYNYFNVATSVQQQQHQHHQPRLLKYNPYVDDDDDNMSMISTTASIMTSRDHPFNNSQRPLLAERKPAQQLLNKKKLLGLSVSSGSPAPPPPRPIKSYVSPYVQQQKRDSAKGLHGFNDFDILSQQYNQHLQSPHIGYPYGSPPSPTAHSSDFVFDTPATATPAPPSTSDSIINVVGNCSNSKHSNNTATVQPRYANISNFGLASRHVGLDDDHCGGGGGSGGGGVTHLAATGMARAPAAAACDYAGGGQSRFEDDFCTRRQADMQRNCAGPFIFGVSHELQQPAPVEVGRIACGHGGRAFADSVMASGSDDSGQQAGDALVYTPLTAAQATMQSTSDTSSSSHDSRSKKGVKFLLRKHKIKKQRQQVQQQQQQQQQQQTKGQLAIGEGNAIKTNIPTIKCVVVGDGAVGKTNLILTYLENRFISEHVPTASDIYNADVMVNDSPVHLTLCDTAGQDTLDPLRELCYPDSDVFLLCFSVAKPETFRAIKKKWAPKFATTKAALILVGTQSDLRTNRQVLNKLQMNGEQPISYADAWDLATTIGAKYIETSSATKEKVKEVFDTAIWEGLLPNALPPTPSFWRKLFCLV